MPCGTASLLAGSSGPLTHLRPFPAAAAASGRITLLVKSMRCAANGPSQSRATEPALPCQQTQPHRHKHCTVWGWLVTSKGTLLLQ